jgi:hypothetical protein
MKRRVLNIGWPATHQGITLLGPLNEPLSISDHDALILDPQPGFLGAGAQGHGAQVIQRRQREIRDLLIKKSGIVICSRRGGLDARICGCSTPMKKSGNDSRNYWDKPRLLVFGFRNTHLMETCLAQLRAFSTKRFVLTSASWRPSASRS